MNPPENDVTGFHCQQCAEKYLKAWLKELGFTAPRIHDLDQLLLLLLPHDRKLRSLRRGLQGLTQYAVDYRYPGHRATDRQAQTALRISGRVREAIRRRLRL
jgi:HEPN domain-containing protein